MKFAKKNKIRRNIKLIPEVKGSSRWRFTVEYVEDRLYKLKKEEWDASNTKKFKLGVFVRVDKFQLCSTLHPPDSQVFINSNERLSSL